VDYVRVLVKESSLTLVTSAGNEERFIQWIDKFCIMEDITLTSVTHEFEMFSLIGPQSHSIMSQLFNMPLPSVGLAEVGGRFGRLAICTNQEFLTSSVDTIVSRDHAKQLWEYLLIETGKEGVKHMHDEAYEAFRISRGIPRFGSELSESYNPYEAGLRNAISFTKGCYIGQEVIARLDTYQKVQRSLIGLILPSIPHYQDQRPTIRQEGSEIGWLTSVSAVPIHGKAVGLGIVRKDFATKGTMVSIDDSGNIVTAHVSNLPIELRTSAYN
jgi:folate-binding protein YgfZ